ncbi:MAG: hypothetical protein AAF577_04910 [Pseudomonadota bacterium]
MIRFFHVFALFGALLGALLGGVCLAGATTAQERMSAGTPITLDAALALRDAGDIAGLENAFNALQSALTDGQIGQGHYAAPFKAFAVANPDIIATLQRWRADFPASSMVATALAMSARYRGRLARGTDVIDRTPRAALNRSRQMRAEAADLLTEALSQDPQNLMAARMVDSLGPDRVDPLIAHMARSTVETLDSPAITMRRRLLWTLGKWGGAPGETDRFCRDSAAASDAVTEEECLAVADLLGRDRRASLGDLIQAAIRVAAIDIDRYAGDIATVLAQSPNRQAEIYDLIDRTGVWFSRNALRTMPFMLGVTGEHVAYWSRIDPTDPLLAHFRAHIAHATGRMGVAMAGIEQSLAGYPYDPDVHVLHGQIAGALGRQGDVLLIAERAARETEGNADAYIPTVLTILSDRDAHALDVGGARHSNFQRRLRDLMRGAVPWCTGIGARASYCWVTEQPDSEPAVLWQTSLAEFDRLTCPE